MLRKSSQITTIIVSNIFQSFICVLFSFLKFSFQLNIVKDKNNKNKKKSLVVRFPRALFYDDENFLRVPFAWRGYGRLYVVEIQGRHAI